MRQKMADNKEIADSFKMEDGVMQVSAEQKTAFDKNMSDIKEIKSLIEGLESMDEVSRWSEAPAADSVAMKADAQAFASEVADAVRKGASAKSLGELFIQSDEFKSLQGGANGANMPSPWQLKDLRLHRLQRQGRLLGTSKRYPRFIRRHPARSDCGPANSDPSRSRPVPGSHHHRSGHRVLPYDRFHHPRHHRHERSIICC